MILNGVIKTHCIVKVHPKEKIYPTKDVSNKQIERYACFFYKVQIRFQELEKMNNDKRNYVHRYMKITWNFVSKLFL